MGGNMLEKCVTKTEEKCGVCMCIFSEWKHMDKECGETMNGQYFKKNGEKGEKMPKKKTCLLTLCKPCVRVFLLEFPRFTIEVVHWHRGFLTDVVCCSTGGCRGSN